MDISRDNQTFQASDDAVMVTAKRHEDGDILFTFAEPNKAVITTFAPGELRALAEELIAFLDTPQKK